MSPTPSCKSAAIRSAGARLPSLARPAPLAAALDAPLRQLRERARERRRLPVPPDLPAQRARDLARHRGARPRGHVGRRARRRPGFRCADRPCRPAPHPRRVDGRLGGRLRRLRARPLGRGGFPRCGARGARQRLVLAEPRESRRRAHRARDAAQRLCDAACAEQPRHRRRRRRRRPDRDDGAPGELRAALRDRRAHLRRLPRRARVRAMRRRTCAVPPTRRGAAIGSCSRTRRSSRTSS